MTKLLIMSLSDYMEILGERRTAGALSRYRSVSVSEPDEFLHCKAVMMEKKDLSRTYLALDMADGCIVGFFSLAVKCMSLDNCTMLSASMRRRMNVDERTGFVHLYMIGQLSRSSRLPPGSGALLLKEGLMILAIAKRIVGCRVMGLDCRDELVGYYEDRGFRLVYRSEDTGMNRMIGFV